MGVYDLAVGEIMYVVFKVEKRRSFLDCREVFWAADEHGRGKVTPSGEPSETISLKGALKFLTSRAAYQTAGEQGRMRQWRVGDR